MMKISASLALRTDYFVERRRGRWTTSEVSEFAGLRLRLPHEVSILITMVGAVGRCRGVEPRAKVSNRDRRRCIFCAVCAERPDASCERARMRPKANILLTIRCSHSRHLFGP